MGAAASTAAATNTTAILICHSSYEPHLRTLLHNEMDDSDVLVILTETFPIDLQTRAELLTACQGAIVAVSPLFQTAPALIETVSFLKDTKKWIIAGPLTHYTRPSGAVGAICTAYGLWDSALFQGDHCSFTQRLEQSQCVLLHLSNPDVVYSLERSRTPQTMEDMESHDTQLYTEARESLSDDVDDNHLFLVHPGTPVGQRIAEEFNGITSQDTHIQGTCSICTMDLTKDLSTLARSRVVAFIITADPATHESNIYRRLFEAARRWNKPILPIHGGGTMHGWLQLAMGGRLYYQVDVNNLRLLFTMYSDIPNSFCKVNDSCPATDFIVCVNGILKARQVTATSASAAALSAAGEQARLQAAREKAQVQGLPAETIDHLCTEVASSLNNSEASWQEWGISTTVEAIDAAQAQDVIPYPSIDDELIPAKPKLELHTQHYTVTRQTFIPPPSVVDTNGLPLPNLQLDAMFSYNWSVQHHVLNVYAQGSVFNLRAWFDVFGHMQGNTNAAMAAAVETVACVVVFVTTSYLKSINCKLEFQYAAHCRKAMILICVEDVRNMQLPSWFTSVVGETFNIYPTHVDPSVHSRVLALDFSAQSINSVSITSVLFGAIRVLAARRNDAPLSVAYDGSELLFATTSALRYKLDQAAQNSGTEAASIVKTLCTRCGAAFHPDIASSLEGCRKHSAYYVGGSLIAGRWACCQDQKPDGVGCQAATHTQHARKWTRDPSYGTYTWQPE